MTGQKPPGGLIPRPLAYGLIVLIALLWGVDVLVHILDPTHELNTTLGTAFLVVSGLLGGLARGRRDPDAGQDDGGDDGDEPDTLPPAVAALPPRSTRQSNRPAAPDYGPLGPDDIPFTELQRRLRDEQQGRP